MFKDDFPKCETCGKLIQFTLTKDDVNLTVTQTFDKKSFVYQDENNNYCFICCSCVRGDKIKRIMDNIKCKK